MGGQGGREGGKQEVRHEREGERQGRNRRVGVRKRKGTVKKMMELAAGSRGKEGE